MKVETTVTLSEDLVEALERRTQGPEGRSAIVEAALRAYLASPRRGEDADDLEIINSHSVELNEEAADVLTYQVIPRYGVIFTESGIHRNLTLEDLGFSSL